MRSPWLPNRLSTSTGPPPRLPWLLHRAWPGSELHLVRTGHAGGDEMTGHMMAALNRFARTER